MNDAALTLVRQHPQLVVADDYEISLQIIQSELKEYLDGKFVRAHTNHSFWMGLRVHHRNRQGFSSTRLASKESLQELVRNAFQSAEHSHADPWCRLPLWKKGTAVPARTDDLPGEFGNSVFPVEKETAGRVTEVYSRINLETWVSRKSEKEPLYWKERYFPLEFKLQVPGKGVVTEKRWGHPDHPPEKCMEDLIRRGRNLSKAEAVSPSGEDFGFILSSRASSQLLEIISPLFCERTDWALKQKIFSPVISIINESGSGAGPIRRPFDLEGTPSRRTDLVREGALESYLHDSYSSGKENRLSTSSRVRAPEDDEPKIGFDNLYLVPGAKAPLDEIRETANGVYIEEFLESSKDAMNQGLGWIVEAGKMVLPVVVHAPINAKSYLETARSVGNDLEFYGKVGSPSIFYEKIPKPK